MSTQAKQLRLTPPQRVELEKMASVQRKAVERLMEKGTSFTKAKGKLSQWEA